MFIHATPWYAPEYLLFWNIDSYIGVGKNVPVCFKCLLHLEKNMSSLLIMSVCRENDITGVIDTTFAVEVNSFGVLKVHELKTGGKEIPVSEDNKKEYVK